MEHEETVAESNLETTENERSASEDSGSTAAPAVVNVYVDDVRLNTEQYEALVGSIQENTVELQTLNASIAHATMLLVLLCVFELYKRLSRARKKGGV